MKPGVRALVAAAIVLAGVRDLTARIGVQATPDSASAAERPSFEVTSIKVIGSADGNARQGTSSGRFTATETARALIEWAFNIKTFQLLGGPAWIDSEKFEIIGKIPDSMTSQLQTRSDQRGAQIRLMAQSLLADRFKLSVSHTTKQLSVYALVIAKKGAKLTASPEYHGNMTVRQNNEVNHLAGDAVPVQYLADAISRELGRTVLDKTGLKGNYNFDLQWTPAIPDLNRDAGNATPAASAPSIFTALEEQLGLKLNSTKGPVDVLIIDHIEEPSPN